MLGVAATNDDVLAELQSISFQLGDLNAIRNGEYDPPRGADQASARRRPRATPDDLFNHLGTIIALLERQNEMLYRLGRFVAPDDDEWDRANS